MNEVGGPLATTLHSQKYTQNVLGYRKVIKDSLEVLTDLSLVLSTV